MERVSSLLIKIMIERHIIQQDKTEIYKTGIELILADIINFSLILLIGLLSGYFLYSVIYIVVIWTVRRFCGGFHAKTYLMCRISTIGTFLLILAVGYFINMYYWIYAAVITIFTILTMLKFAPVRHPNRELTETEVKANRLFSLISTLFFSIIAIILIAMKRKEGIIIELTLLAITILMYIGMLTNGKGAKTNVKSDG